MTDQDLVQRALARAGGEVLPARLAAAIGIPTAANALELTAAGQGRLSPRARAALTAYQPGQPAAVVVGDFPADARAIRALCEDRGWTGRDLAAELGCSEGAVSGWLAGMHPPRGGLRHALVELGAQLVDRPTAQELVLQAVRETPGMRPAEIAKALDLKISAVWSALKNLRSAGLVEPADGSGTATPTPTPSR